MRILSAYWTTLMLANIDPTLTMNRYSKGIQSPMYGLNDPPLNASTFMLVYRVEWAARLLFSRMVSAVCVSLPQFRMFNETTA
jgi:hypothetical protein